MAERDAEQEARRRAEAERARKRAALRSQISQWESKLSRVEAQISALSRERSKLDTCLSDWNTQKSIYSGSRILSEVVILNVFEGVCADKIKSDLETSIQEMDRTHTDVSGLNGNVSAQISRLRQYADEIRSKLASLRSELNSI